MNKKLLIVLSLLILAPLLRGQDLAGYEVVENSEIGLDVAPFEKWGVAVADIDRNDYPDIFTIRWASPGYSRVYLNEDGLYSDITDQTPLESIEANESHTTTVSLVDYDNDGDRDIFFGTDTHMYLLQNNDNVFTDIAESVGLTAGIPGFVNEYQFRMGAWADYDLDGDLDLIVGQQNNPDLLFYRNDDGSFVDIAAELGFEGIADYEGEFNIPQGTRRTRHIAWIDFDMDGDPDLNVGGLIFRNDDGAFTDITEETGFNPSQIEAATWFDYDNDGDLDYFKAVVTGHLNELWENQDGTMVDISQESGVSFGDAYRGVTVGDFENDGDQDIFVQNNNTANYEVLLVNDELDDGRAFADVAEFIGLDVTGDRKGAAFMDYDMDGFLDIYVASAQHQHIMYHNLTVPAHNWVGFMLEGTESNRDAVGTLVKLYTGETMQIRYTQVPNSWQCQDNPYVHFGIGMETSIDSVVIHWSLGLKEVITDVAINQYHKIREGDVSSSVRAENQVTPEAYRLEQNYPNPFNGSTQIRYHLKSSGKANLSIYNLRGELVRTLVERSMTAGEYTVDWDGRSDFGANVSSGVYVYTLKTTGHIESKKMLYLR
ncbi:T9SS type A sorting domain-containing protein [candidate division KSB1 bacterium]|nr:T9SS type A sorting domain-containing protein [candidate division KSB1 bacterium]